MQQMAKDRKVTQKYRALITLNMKHAFNSGKLAIAILKTEYWYSTWTQSYSVSDDFIVVSR